MRPLLLHKGPRVNFEHPLRVGLYGRRARQPCEYDNTSEVLGPLGAKGYVLQSLYGACRLDGYLFQNLSAEMHTAMRVGPHV